MSKSVVQMLSEAFTRIAALESEVTALKRRPEQTVKVLIDNPLAKLKELAEKQSKPDRKMCPKCGVKPGYFFHVKSCRGQKEKENDADTIRRRDQGTT